MTPPNGRGLRVEIIGSIESVSGREWDELVSASHSSVYHRFAYLRAFERSPLADGRAFYVLVRTPAGGLAAAFPIYLQDESDPLGVLGDLVPPGRGPALLGHSWYCADTALPYLPSSAFPEADIFTAAFDAVETLADRHGAGLVGFVNVAAGHPLLAAGDRRGWTVQQIDARFRLPLDGVADLASYVASLERRPRHNMRRILRRAEEAGAVTNSARPTADRLADICELAQLTAAKFGNAEYFRKATFVPFVLALGELAVLTEVRVDGELVAGGVSLRDPERFYIWVHGARYETIGSYSPSYLLWAHEFRTAIEAGAVVVECGRGSETFKRRYGMRPLPLFACVTQS